jgi:CRP-like cAMP-binding protein
LFTISRDHFLQLIQADPQLSTALLMVFCQRQRNATRLVVGEYAQRDIPARLAHRVLELTGTDPSSESVLKITQAQLAKFVFVSRQVVNQHLSDWQSRGWISTSPRHLRVTDRQALLAVAASGAQSAA